MIDPKDIKISSIVVKIASRCNINCDYCYVYKHADQSYKKQPRTLSCENIALLAQRLDEYIGEAQIDTIGVCLHGGEPLIAGIEHLELFFATINNSMANKEKIRFAIQTNGVLLTKPFLEIFRKYRVGVSLSLDGPAAANDKHRLDHRGRSTYSKVLQALTLLTEEYKELFLGIISVIDPTNSPEEIIDFFAALNPPSHDLLFPDANHFIPPPGRLVDIQLYEEWITRAITHWYVHHPELPLRMFKNICDAILGRQTESEFFGNGKISYLIVETDGSYHYSDMLKATYEGASHTGMHLTHATIEQVVGGAAIQKYQDILLGENKCVSCHRCPEFSICGSGQIVHRYGPNGFNHPTVYCREMLAMIGRARHLMAEKMAAHMVAQPASHSTELVQNFFSEESIYLLGAILGEKIPFKNACALHFENTTLSAAVDLICQAFPAYGREQHFVNVNSMELEGIKDAILCAEIILKKFLEKKIEIFLSYFIPAPDINHLFECAYLAGHSYRFWQSLAAKELCHNTYSTALAHKAAFLRAIDSLHSSPLCSRGQCFLSALYDEFLPGDRHGTIILSA